MVNNKIGQTFKKLGFLLKKNSPAILTGIGITGMISTTIIAVKSTPKALEVIDELKRKHQCDNNGEAKDFDKKEYSKDFIKKVVPIYIPATITCAISTACIIGASSVNNKRNAALATAYKISESALSEYKNKIIETIGEKKEQQVRDSIAKDYVDKNPVSNTEVILTDKGYTLCLDKLSGRYFYSDIEKIKKIVNELNRTMLTDMYVSLNDLYFELGLDATDLGSQMGWNLDRGLIELEFSATVSSDDRPCIVLDYKIPPIYNYQNLY